MDELPTKTREVQNFALDSTRWNSFVFRDSDIVIASWAKSGTTWLQQIVAQLLMGPSPDLRLDKLSPWIEHRFVPVSFVLGRAERQVHRRFVKTHLPLDALVYSPRAKYIFIGRDGRDTIRSMYAFHCNHTELAYRITNETPGLVGPKFEPPRGDFIHYFSEWLSNDGYPWWPFWSHIRSWWAFRHMTNIQFVHFNNLKTNLLEEMRGIASYLDITPSVPWEQLVEMCTFESMKKNSSSNFSPASDGLYSGGMSSFFRKGESGEWRHALPAALIESYERTAFEELPPECATWLATGHTPK